MSPIYFYSNIEEHGYLSNFSPHGFELDGLYWPTAEHYFQAQKFADRDHAETIRRAESPKKAKSLGRSRAHPIRPDWDEVRVSVMRRAVLARFTAHRDIREVLLATGDEELIEAAPNDYFWGAGRHGTGQNMLGKILMETRTQLRYDS